MSDTEDADSGWPGGADPQTDFDEWVAWLDREAAAGRDPVPPERVQSAQGICVSVGDAGEIDPGLVSAVCGTRGEGGGEGGARPQGKPPGHDGTGAGFAQGAAADVLPPGPALAALTEAAVADVTRLTDDQLIGVLQAARRQENREAWKKALVIAEFARRREAEFSQAAALGGSARCRPGQFPGEELAIELVLGPVQASHAIDDATGLVTRLPATLAGMAVGLIDEARAAVIAMYTRSLTPADAALADRILAIVAPGLRLDQLARKAAALELRLDPEAVRARKEHARRTRQRVEVYREDSGNACVAGRELDTGDALAAKAHIHALALRLRRAGTPGNLDRLRLLVFADLTAGRDPLDRLASPPGPGTSPAEPADPAYQASPADPASPSPATPGTSGVAGDGFPVDPGGFRANHGSAPPPKASPSRTASGTPERDEAPGHRSAGSLDYDDYDRDHHSDGDDADAATPPPRPPAPVPALINLVVPAGTLFGWDTTPAEAGGWALLDAGETQDIVATASRHPATRWCVTVTGPDGTAVAHGCAAGRRPWAPGDPWAPGEQHDKPPPGDRKPEPAPGQAARLAAFLRGLNLPLQPVATDCCDHAAAEPGYTPSRKLAHLVRARTATCDAPGCAAQAVHGDLDHTTPYPGGLTDQCNLGPKCRRHHRAKQAPDWKVEQPAPGVIRWTLPSGRTHVTRPTVWDTQPGMS